MPDTIVIALSYDGAPFAGYQIQPDRETVQGRLEGALATVLGGEVRTTCAGRTDAGVHARGQVVSYPATGEEPDDLESMRRSLDALSGERISVNNVRRAVEGFSARHSALAREYRYRLVPGAIRPVFLEGYAWWTRCRLDAVAMRQAGSVLVGEHDFASFCVAEAAREKETTRTIERIDVWPERELGEHCLVVTVVGRSFLHSMVRIIVGTLVEVGRGRRDPGSTVAVLEARRRDAADRTAPAEGLTLWHVDYPSEVWLP